MAVVVFCVSLDEGIIKQFEIEYVSTHARISEMHLYVEGRATVNE